MMSPDEFRSCLEALHWSQNHLARILGIDDRMTRRWAAGANPVPTKVANVLRALAAAHRANPFPASIWDDKESG